METEFDLPTELEIAKLHGNTKPGYCNVCHTQVQSEFYKGKKNICKKCWAKQIAANRQEKKKDEPVKEKPKKVDPLVTITTIAESVSSMAESLKQKDELLKSLQKQITEQNLLIKQQSSQITEQTILIKKLTDQISVLSEQTTTIQAIQDEIADELGDIKETIPCDNALAEQQIKRIKFVLHSVVTEEYTAKELRGFGEEFDIELPKSSSAPKDKIKQKLISGLEELLRNAKK